MPPAERLEAEARLPTQHWSSLSVVPVMVAVEAPRFWTRLRRHLPPGWEVSVEVRWNAPSVVLSLVAEPPGRGMPASRSRKRSARR
jgi:hypothetical protein